MPRLKISVVGAGNVGGSIAQRLAEKNWYDVALLDVIDGMPQGKALDLLEAGPVYGYDSVVSGGNHYDFTTGSSVVVITACTMI